MDFALIGLYLVFEQSYTGKQVHHMHAALARRTKRWPTFPAPTRRADITVRDVLLAQPCVERDTMIYQWCVSVRQVYAKLHSQIEAVIVAKREVMI